jgi:hypothetical protein
MTQYEIDSAVAARTGEELREIQSRGFSIGNMSDINFDPEPDDSPPQTVDWDELDLMRNVAVYDEPRRQVA